MIKLLLSITCIFQLAQAASEIKTAEFIDLNRYLGKWYEVAAIPQPFQRDCISNVTAEYTLAEKSQIQVFNSCTDKNGGIKSATGMAKIVDETSNAKLKVSFIKLGAWIFIGGGDYWILDIESEYRWAIVGDGSQKYGWILSREPVLPLSELKIIAEKIHAQGYDTCAFLTTIQDGGFKARQPLCDVVE
ncbi:MAG: lipocalin family protein [Bdellovibrionaceae bacterium]|nr:lipocalin family protein [Pseudobdellovibrionaceae bacterium]